MQTLSFASRKEISSRFRWMVTWENLMQSASSDEKSYNVSNDLNSEAWQDSIFWEHHLFAGTMRPQMFLSIDAFKAVWTTFLSSSEYTDV